MKSPFKHSKIGFRGDFLNYLSYQQSRDAAWKMLVDCDIRTLPVNVGAICKRCGYKLYAYSRNEELLKGSGLHEQSRMTDGFSVRSGTGYAIFYNDTKPVPRQRFTVAHEIGHIVLGEYTVINREPTPHDDPLETQANQFAARLLAPAYVLHELRAFTPERISELCDISMQAARFRADRIKTLEQRQRYLSHPLERAIAKQFAQFIKGLQ